MKKIYSFIIIILLLFTISGCNKHNRDFEKYLDELFLFFIGDDPLNINNSLYYPEVYGLENEEVKSVKLSKEKNENYYYNLTEIKTSLEMFSKLDEDDELTKAILLDYIDRELAFSNYYYYGTYLESYLGYQAQIPIILAEYRFDDLHDIENYFKYLETTKDTFSEFIKYENEKMEMDMGLPKKIIERTIIQCNEFLNTEENFLIPVFNNKIDELSFLNKLEREELKCINQSLVNNEFLNAYKYLRNELIKLKDIANNSGGLATLPNGKEYYEALFQKATGSDLSIPEAKIYLESILDRLLKNYNKDYLIYTSTYNYKSDFIGDLKLDELMPYFSQSMKNDFPRLNVNIEYKVKEIDESMQNNSAPAMYFISPIDDNRDEVIYINPLNVGSLSNYTYQTIAHEGFPGHLYHNVYIKNTDLPNVRKILNYVGYYEAWATYVENYVIKYGGGTDFTMEVFEFFDSVNYLVLGLLDIGINYEGWSLNESITYLKNFFDINEDEAITIYYDLIELPTNYLQYYFSYYLLQDLKSNFRIKMRKDYSDLLFHTIYLETGPVPFSILEEQYENYQ